MTIKLKRYQQASLDILQRYLEMSRFKGARTAYDTIQTERFGGAHFKPFQPLSDLEESPYVCLRLPTGGGKTLLSTYSVRLAAESYIEKDYPLTLWLVPTNIIKQQTLETLKNPDHPNYKVLEESFNGRFRVFDIADFRQIRPQDISDSACIIVSTFAALRIDKTEGRKAYDHDENLEPHFGKIPSQTQSMERDEVSGQIKFSFVNLLYWHGPLVIIDEAHNAKSDLSIEVLRRVNAACIIEYTATPAKNSNVICAVSAAELKAEEMIKLPIHLKEHVSWMEAITASIQARQKLEELSAKDRDYIRPIVLFQAENKDKEITVEVLKQYLIENEGIDSNQIAIATGEQKDLDQINLFDPNCPIRYVVTVQALKEGWDCSFAYVLCSVANTKSEVAVEQLLGRVLRMPYARKRAQPQLNEAYAHVSSQSWPAAVSKLKDCLVNMGFESLEAEEAIYLQSSFLPENEDQPIFEMTLSSPPDLSHLDKEEKESVKVAEISSGEYSIKVESGFNSKLIEKISKSLSNKEDREEFTLRAKNYLYQQKENLAPAQRGEVFCIPQLCLDFNGEIELAESELYLNEGWSLLDYPTAFNRDVFSVEDKTREFLADIAGEKIQIKAINANEQLSLEGIHTNLTENDLCRWLDRKLHQPDIKQPIMLEFLRRVVTNLLNRGDLDLAELVRGRFILEKVLSEKIAEYRKQAAQSSYQTYMFGKDSIVTVVPDVFSFKFNPNLYPASQFYEGHLGFDKHYYRAIAAMNAEEAECAQAIDRNSLVKFWVRNLDRQPLFSFWLPTATDKFYPDFIVQLNDGRLLVIEYKGAHLDNSDTQEKELIGKTWAEKSGNLFLIAWKKDGSGRDVYQQINAVLS